MINRLFLAIIIVLLILILGGYGYVKILEGKVETLKPYKGLYEAERNQNVIYKDESNKWHNKSEVLEFEAKTLRQQLREGDSTLNKILAENKQIKKGFRNLNQYSQIATKTETKFSVALRDTIFKHDTIHHYARTFYWYNKYYEVSGIVTKDSISPIITSYDSLSVIGWWERDKNFLFIKYGKKKNYIDVKSNNPDTKITFNRNIILKRNKK